MHKDTTFTKLATFYVRFDDKVANFKTELTGNKENPIKLVFTLKSSQKTVLDMLSIKKYRYGLVKSLTKGTNKYGSVLSLPNSPCRAPTAAAAATTAANNPEGEESI